jgi:hypothetical protein
MPEGREENTGFFKGFDNSMIHVIYDTGTGFNVTDKTE